MCCCQVFCIPKFRVFMRCCYYDVVSDTKSQTEKYFLFFAILIVGVFLCGMCGLSYLDGQIEGSLQQIACISEWMMQTTTDVHFNKEHKTDGKGMQRIYKEVDSLINTFQQNSTTQALKSLSELNFKYEMEQFNHIHTLIINLSVYSSCTLQNPDPYNDTIVIPDFASRLGTVDQLGTVTQQLLDEATSRFAKISLLNQISKNSQVIRNINIKEFVRAKDQIRIFSKQFVSKIQNIEDWIEGHTWMFDAMVKVYRTYLELVCMTVMLMIFSFSLVTWFRFQKIAFLLHLSWLAACVLLIFGLATLALVQHAALINSNLVCPIARRFHEPKIQSYVLNKFTATHHLDSLSKQIEVCIRTNGDFITYLHLQKPVNQILTLGSDLENLKQIALKNDILQKQLKLMAHIKHNYGVAYSNANIALHEMNRWTDFSLPDSLQTCNKTQDEWEWNESQCRYHHTTGADYVGFRLCFILDQPDDSFANTRYGNFCNHNATLYFNSTRLYISSLKQILFPLTEQYTLYENKLNQLDVNLTNKNITLYGDQLTPMFNIIQDLKNDMNCSYIRQGADRLKNTFCITLLNGLFFMYLYLICICILLTLLSCLGVWSAMRCIPKSESHLIFLEANNEINGVSPQRRPFEIA